MTAAFIRRPGLSGPFGALMDEYARAAEDFCRVVEGFDSARFLTERASDNPSTISPQARAPSATRTAGDSQSWAACVQAFTRDAASQGRNAAGSAEAVDWPQLAQNRRPVQPHA